MPRLPVVLRLFLFALLLGVWLPAHAESRAAEAGTMVPGNDTGQAAIARTIGEAARLGGVNRAYLVAQAEIESSMVPHARARGTSATGLFQFLDATWIETVQRYAERFAPGIDPVIDRIRAGTPIRSLAPGERRHLLSLRNDPSAASLVAAALAGENAAKLERLLGREASDVELYLAHFLGTGGARQFLKAWAANPRAAAANILPAAARANRSVFYTTAGAPRSLDAVRQLLASKIGHAKRRTSHLLQVPATEETDGNIIAFNHYFSDDTSPDLITPVPIRNTEASASRDAANLSSSPATATAGRPANRIAATQGDTDPAGLSAMMGASSGYAGAVTTTEEAASAGSAPSHPPPRLAGQRPKCDTPSLPSHFDVIYGMDEHINHHTSARTGHGRSHDQGGPRPGRGPPCQHIA